MPRGAAAHGKAPKPLACAHAALHACRAACMHAELHACMQSCMHACRAACMQAPLGLFCLGLWVYLRVCLRVSGGVVVIWTLTKSFRKRKSPDWPQPKGTKSQCMQRPGAPGAPPP
ncbi:hypothetical protein ENH_00048300 [Eimeria necatrix]|uniref:Uncharacterized protein n=1 Tax=Eimeria necatrix TaxID=51315 RepID=U6MMK2_9EIME|nr:hypothetical protein ENH_00048300 [Eimeria necatrix]CDJ63674.1 hypothetical protein ENH_00048300 [Eimeria necatrix]